jgi:glycosyltransferase involved in cell wall biosynthesis
VENLPATIADLPRQIEGIDTIEILVIDDGSTDGTSEVARAHGVDHIVRFQANQGLARAFAAGLEAALRAGADIIVNTDADNQYVAADIAKLVQPIIERRADMVIGARDIRNIGHFSVIKKLLQWMGSSFVRRLTHSTLPDMTSGFRAYDREAAMRLNIFSEFTYTLETILQADASGITITHVPIRTNAKVRESRLFASLGEYVARSLTTIMRIYTMYNPLRVFTTLAAIFVVPGCFLLARFLYFYFTLSDVQTGHIQSLVVAAILVILGFQIYLFGLLADITSQNRKLLEDILLRVKKYDLQPDPNDNRH